MQNKARLKRKGKEEIRDREESSGAKRLKVNDFNATVFKHCISESSSLNTGFEQFLEASKLWSDGAGVDIVQMYCTSSPECVEIFQVLEAGSLKIHQINSLLRCLEQILLRIADDLGQLYATGLSVVKRLLATHVHTILKTLNMKNKSNDIKTALKLLVAMVMLGSKTAKLLLNNINLAHSTMLPLLQRRDVKDDEDVRTCFLHLIVAFLLTHDNDVIRKLVQTKGLMEAVCLGIEHDTVDTVRLMLTTMLEKVIVNPGISKTIKVQMFSLKALKGLTHLYNWQGPANWKLNLKHKGKQPAYERMETDYRSSEEKVIAAELADHFLSELCTSFKHGIIFHDTTHGLSGRNQNRLMTSFLGNFCGDLSHDLVRKLVIGILTACPDQLQHFFPRISHLLTPRESGKWRDAMNFLTKTYRSLGHSVSVLRLKEKQTVENIVEIFMVYTLPASQVFKIVLSGLKVSSLAVNHITLGFIKQISETAVQVLNMIKTWTTYSELERLEICDMYKAHVHKNLPDVMTVFMCLDKVMTLKKSSQDDVTKLQDLCGATLSDVVTEIVQILCLYQDWHPSLLSEHPVVLAKLIDGVMGQESDVEHPEVSQMVKVYLLKLLAGTETKRLPWEQKNVRGQSLLYQLLHMLTQLSSSSPELADVCLHLVCKLLLGTGPFEAQYDDLLVWIQCCQHSEPDVLDFVSKVMMTYIRNPYPYMDRFHDLHSHPEGFLEPTEKQKTQIYIKDIIALNVSLEDEGDIKPSNRNNRYPFCPMLIVGLDMLEKLDTTPKALQIYMSQVVLKIFHQQVSPFTLCNLLTKHKQDLLLPKLYRYIHTWTETESSGSKAMCTKVRLEEFLSENTGIITGDCDPVSSIRQDLLHLSHLIQSGKKECDKECMKRIKKLKKAVVSHVKEICATEKTDNYPNRSKAFDVQLGSLLDSKDQRSLITAARLVLDHPIMKRFFLQEDRTPGNQSISNIVTAMVTEILEVIFEQDMQLGDTIDGYYERISYVLKSMTEGESGSEQVWKILNVTVSKLTVDQCREVLNLALNATSDNTGEENGLLVQLLESLVDILINSNVKVVKLTEEGLHKLLCCFADCEGLNEKVYKFMTRFPLLSSQCSFHTFETLLLSSRHCRLVQFLLENNVTLASHMIEMIQSVDIDWSSPDKLQIVVMFIKSCLLEPASGDNEWREATRRIVKVLKSELLSLCEGKTTEHTGVLDIALLLINNDLLGDKLVSKMRKRLSATLQNMDCLRPHHIDLFCTLCNKDGRQQVLVNCITCLLAVHARMDPDSTSGGSGEVQDKLLAVLADLTQEEIQTLTASAEFANKWHLLIKSTLKFAFTKANTWKFLTSVLPIIYKQDDIDIGVSLEDVVAMVTGHLSFSPMMYGENGHECKEMLVSLMLVLIQQCPAACHQDHITVFLGAYSASLSLIDQKLLRLIHIYEGNGVSLTESRPMLWGEKAIEIHEVWETRGASLNRNVLAQVMSNLDNSVMKHSTLHFPLRRKVQDVELRSAEEYKSESACYDPCFFLPLISHLLEPECVVDCRRFIQCGCLGYTISALSSHDKDMRTAAQHTLEKFQGHLGVARIPEREQLQYMLHVVLNSIPKEKNKLTSIITQFLARTAGLMLKPDEHMYPVLNQYLLLKPCLDIANIPDFFRLFNSSAIQYQAERSWILTLLNDGLRESADYWIYEKKFTFKLLQAFYHSKLSSGESQCQVIQILTSACKERRLAVDLCKNHGFLAWIASAVTSLSPDKVQPCTGLYRLMCTVWASVVGESQTDTKSDQIAFSLQVLTCVKTMFFYIRNVSEELKLQFLKTVSSVLGNLCCVEEKMRGCQVHSLTRAEVLLLLLQCQPDWAQGEGLKQYLTAVCKAVGIDLSGLENSQSQSVRKRFTKESEHRPTEEVDTDTANNEVEIENTENIEETKALLVKEIARILGLWKLCDSSRSEDCAVEVLVVRWILDQSRLATTGSGETVRSLIELVHRFIQPGTADLSSGVLAYISRENSSLATEIVMDVLNTYNTLAKNCYKNRSKCTISTDMKMVDDGMGRAVVLLNEVVSAIYRTRHNMSHSKMKAIIEQHTHRLKVCKDSQASRSVILRHMFVEEF